MKPAVKAIVSFTSDRLKEKRIIKMAKSDSISIIQLQNLCEYLPHLFSKVFHYESIIIMWIWHIIAWIIFLWKLFETK